eukprot:CAMPEP_0119480040 /NCGR_PEP_ID=MMETSP1344-20130328/9032_1 /TAXON_ID=236787 /ORGANISM="Florenciella parvula, Strain CCMP2471" /LENGTH=504 /DNA_ID=CAMNT_0007514319 /DNA_START=27 /DNA_END=1541 /DNA_ORIENTATION=+
MAAAEEDLLGLGDGGEGKSGAAEDSKDGGKDAEPSFDWMPDGCVQMADGEYDVVVMGTGFTECLLSGLLSVMGMKVLVVDRNNYYGSEAASLNLTNLYKRFHDGASPQADFFATIGGANGPAKDRDFNVDLVPKFIMAHGNLVKILLHTKVTRYLDFKSIDGSFVVKGSKVHKVPATPQEALASSLMGMFEKRRFRTFLIYVADYDKDDPTTFKGRDLNAMTAQELYGAFGLDTYTQEFIGHAMALYMNDEYLSQPAVHLVNAVQLYSNSLTNYENAPSPYLYPMYGLGGLPESFSRLAAINGGTFMLNRDVDEILFDAEGKAWGIRGGNEVAKATMFIGEPSYFPAELVRATGQVVRSLCFLDHLPKNVGQCQTGQIILPGSQVGRQNDIYISFMSKKLEVVAPGVCLAIVSTRVEGHQNPVSEVEPGIALLGAGILQRFDSVSDCYEPVEDGLSNKCFISKSYDETSHFKTAADDVLDMYYRVTGEELDMSIDPKVPEPGDY